MARKNLLTNIVQATPARTGDEERHDYAWRGASRSMRASIDEMAENAKRMLAGEAVVHLDTALIDGSFLTDRMEDNEEDYQLLKAAVSQFGQSSPILVRPHPEVDGRYMIVFGHRRARVARELGIPVLAIVKQIEEIAHIIAQGQENAARANLSFIERAMLARRLLTMGQERHVIKSALAVDDTLLSRMLAVAEAIPLAAIEAIGTARTVGRDRWEELKKLLLDPRKSAELESILRADGFAQLESVARFNLVLSRLKHGGKRRARSQPRPSGHRWTSPDEALVVTHRMVGKSLTLSFGAEHAGDFGRFVADNLDGLYRQFKAAHPGNNTGD